MHRTLVVAPPASGALAFVGQLLEENCKRAPAVVVGAEGDSWVPHFLREQVTGIGAPVDRRQKWASVVDSILAEDTDESQLLVLWDAWMVPTLERERLLRHYRGPALLTTMSVTDIESSGFDAWYFLGSKDRDSLSIENTFGPLAAQLVARLHPSQLPNSCQREYVVIARQETGDYDIELRTMELSPAVREWLSGLEYYMRCSSKAWNVGASVEGGRVSFTREQLAQFVSKLTIEGMETFARSQRRAAVQAARRSTDKDCATTLADNLVDARLVLGEDREELLQRLRASALDIDALIEGAPEGICDRQSCPHDAPAFAEEG